MSKINQIFTFTNGVPTSVVAIVGQKHYQTDSSHPNWTAILDAVRKDDADAFVKNIDVKHAFENYVEGNVRVVGNEVFYGTTRLHGVVVNRIFEFMTNDLPVRPLLKFINKLFLNPSSRAVDELYTFLEHRHLPITSDGNIRAYKGLQGNFYSITAPDKGHELTLIHGKTDEQGHIFNGVGELVECLRWQVDDNKDVGCSKGLHIGSLEYAKGFAQGKLVIVEVDPQDVVSIPKDCSFQKMRACKYRVIEEYTQPLDNNYVRTGDDDEVPDENVDGNYDGPLDESDYSTGHWAGYHDGVNDCGNHPDEVSSDYSDYDSFLKGYNDGYADGHRDAQ